MGHQPLQRVIGLTGATLIGLGSMLGTGIFVSIGIAAGVTGPWVIFAILLAALVACCNALSSAQLAASHPVSGGTYAYGYRYLHPALGFTAGWMFLCAKTASAATAALGFAAYLLHLFQLPFASITPVAAITVALLTLLAASGMRRTNLTNTVIVAITLCSLGLFSLSGSVYLLQQDGKYLNSFFTPDTLNPGDFLYATALMFVAYTGYGRLATLGEEVKQPRTTIPKAIMLSLLFSALLYVWVTLVALGVTGWEQLASATRHWPTPLEMAANTITIPGLPIVVIVGACTAMLGVLLNLILGLSRTVLAMGRQQDLPKRFAVISGKHQTPAAAIIGIGISILGLVAIGNVKTTWSFSAFTVLIYYAITNLAALRLPKTERRYPAIIAWIGLFACLFLAFWVPLAIGISGLGLITLGLLWHCLYRSFVLKR